MAYTSITLHHAVKITLYNDHMNGHYLNKITVTDKKGETTEIYINSADKLDIVEVEDII
jgi:hypothetical protein